MTPFQAIRHCQRYANRGGNLLLFFFIFIFFLGGGGGGGAETHVVASFTFFTIKYTHEICIMVIILQFRYFHKSQKKKKKRDLLIL